METPAVPGEIPEKPVAAKKGRKTTLLFAAKIVLSLGLLVAVILKVRPSLPSLSSIDWSTVAIAVGILLLQPPLLAARWRLILRTLGGDLPFMPLLQTTWISVLAGQFLPASVGGDLVRVISLRSETKDLGRVVSSVVVDRAVALIGIAVLAVIFCPLLIGVGDPSMVLLTAAVAGGGILCVPILALLAGPVERAAARVKWLAPVAVLLRYIRIFLAKPWQAFSALGIAILIHALSVAALVVIAAGLGINVEVVHLIGVSVLITFAMALPISIGGWGVREAVAVTLLGFFGVKGDTALLAALLLGVCYALASLPGAPIWLVRTHKAKPEAA